MHFPLAITARWRATLNLGWDTTHDRRRGDPGAYSILLQDGVSHLLPELQDRPGRVNRDARGDLAVDRTRALVSVGSVLGALALFFLGFLDLGMSILPHAVAPTITNYSAEAPPASSVFGLLGVLFVLPLVLVYTAFVYWTFRGKFCPATAITRPAHAIGIDRPAG